MRTTVHLMASPQDFEWVGLSGDGTTAQGWKASATLAPGTYNNLNVHTQVDDNQTSAVENRAIDLVIACPQLTSIGDYVWKDDNCDGI